MVTESPTLTYLSRLCLMLFLITHGIAVDDPSELLNIFNLMRSRGLAELKYEIEKGSLHVSDLTNQYLVVAVLSKDELESSKTWTSISKNVDKRFYVYFNEKSNECKKQIGKKPMHGEVICLYYKNRLEDMIQTFKDEVDDTLRPIVVMFSVYIPCALISGVPYSCAEELGMNALVNYGTYKMIVGFDDVFINTNASAAKEFLCHGGIDVYEIDKNKNHIKVYATGMISGNWETSILFQTQFLKCLGNKENPIQMCTENCQSVEFTDDFLRNYVNALSYNCTRESVDLRGPLTELKRQGFLDRAKEFIKDHTDNACGNLATVTQYWIEFCVTQALQSSTVIGAQTNSPGQWEVPPFNLPWSLLYRFNPEVRFPKAHCTSRVLQA